jgi:hypothetical protein
LTALGLNPLVTIGTVGAPGGIQNLGGGPADEAAYRGARSLLKAKLDAAKLVRASTDSPLSSMLEKQFDDALNTVDTLEKASMWIQANAALPTLAGVIHAIEEAQRERKAFDDAYAPQRALVEQARAPAGAGKPVPATAQRTLDKAGAKLEKLRRDADWGNAAKSVPALVAAAQNMVKLLKDGDKVYAALDAIKADRDAALAAARLIKGQRGEMGKLGLVAENFSQADDVMKNAIANVKWTQALAAVADVKAWGAKLIQSKADFDAASGPFKTKFKELDIAAGNEAADDAPERMKKAEVKAFRDALIAVIDARDAGDFATATAGLPKLGTALAALKKAHAKLADELGAFQADMEQIPDLHAARTFATSSLPALAQPVADFNAAARTIDAAELQQDFAAARAALPALKKAVTALVQARSKINAGTGAAQVSALTQKVDALKARTDKAAEKPVPTFVETLQQIVRDRVAAILAALKANQVVEAELDLGLLPGNLDLMEKAKKDNAAFLVKFNAARDGDVAKARALALAPAKLAAARDQALNGMQLRIMTLANNGSFAEAEQATQQWAKAAKAWGASKVAFDSLNGPNPDWTKLSALNALPGGSDVLDALVGDLPANPPQKVMAAALKARYGFSVKRFEDRNQTVSDLSDLQPNSPDAPDKSLKRTYEMLGKVPVKNIKGKLDELVIFDKDVKDKRGARYEGKKVYMYYGRSEDSAAQGGAKQRFNKSGEIVPEGEQVDESCRPTSTEPIPLFDFGLLHEAGHELDDAEGFMNKKLGDDVAFGAWKKHTVDDIAGIAARHFKYDKAFVLKTLSNPSSKPPDTAPPRPKDVPTEDEWVKAREAVVGWCQSVREYCEIWYQASACKQLMIDGRVYQEGYLDGNRWYSYRYAARGQGISGYQFRAPGEWFAELYAAFYSKRLQPSHPSVPWLKRFGPPQG